MLTTRNVNDADGLKYLAACAPDLLVSAFFNQRLQPAALALPTRGCLNIHPSLLPEAKGVDPVFLALLRDVPQSGAGSYQSWPTRQEVRILRARGGALLRFADLARLVRRQLPQGATARVDPLSEAPSSPSSTS